MLKSLLLAALAAGAMVNPVSARAKTDTTICAPLGKVKAELLKLKAAGWTIADEGERNRFALALASCTGTADAELRDGIGFEGLQHYLRRDLLTEQTRLALLAEFQQQLLQPDRAGFRRPFAVLNLSEIARTDRIRPYLTAEQRTALVKSGVDYLRSTTDYRGFDSKQGYRHGVAHGADLLMQLTLNPAVDKDALATMRDAVAIQVAPPGTAYVTGESERLARPILFMAQRGVFSESEWLDWLAQFSGPGALGTWDGAFQSQAGLMRRHNVTAFLSAIYVNAQASGSEAMKPLAKASLEALKKLP